MLTPNFRNAYSGFRQEYPNIGIQLSVGTFRELKTKLDKGKLDIAFTIDFDIKNEPRYFYENVDLNVGVALIARLHPLSKKKKLRLADLKNENLIIVDHPTGRWSPENIWIPCPRKHIRS